MIARTTLCLCLLAAAFAGCQPRPAEPRDPAGSQAAPVEPSTAPIAPQIEPEPTGPEEPIGTLPT